MQFLGYALSAFGPNYITWIFLERMFRRKNIPTPVMAILPGILSIFITLQTQYAYQVHLNSLATLISIYLLACCYRVDWMHRLFVSVAFLVCGVISEGSGWLIARMLVEVRDMSHVNEESHFVLIALLSLALQVVYMVIITSIFQLFKKKKIKPTLWTYGTGHKNVL